MEYDLTMLINYGALGICLAYFIYKDNKTSKEINDTLIGLKEVVTVMKEVMTKKEV
jgi:hypothetical protein